MDRGDDRPPPGYERRQGECPSNARLGSARTPREDLVRVRDASRSRARAPTLTTPNPEPAHTKRQAFCEGLWDGVVLCRLLNALAPGTPVDAMRADDPSLLDEPEPGRVLRKHNHAAFVRGAKDLGIDDDDMFSLDDLGGLRGDPSRVLRCLTALKWRTDASLNDAADALPVAAALPRTPDACFSKSVMACIAGFSFANAISVSVGSSSASSSSSLSSSLSS